VAAGKMPQLTELVKLTAVYSIDTCLNSVITRDVLPDNGVLAGFVACFALHTDHLDSTGVERRRNTHLSTRQLVHTQDTVVLAQRMS